MDHWIYMVMLAIIISVIFILLKRQLKYHRKRLSTYNVDYRKLNSNYSHLNSRQTLNLEDQDDEEENDEDELTLFEKIF